MFTVIASMSVCAMLATPAGTPLEPVQQLQKVVADKGSAHGKLHARLIDRGSRLDAMLAVKAMPRGQALDILELLFRETPPDKLDQDLVRLAMRTAYEVGLSVDLNGSARTYIDKQSWADIFYSLLDHEELPTRGQALICLDALSPIFDRDSCTQVAQLLDDSDPLLVSRALEFIIFRPAQAKMVAQRALEILDASSDAERNRWSAEREDIAAGIETWGRSRERLVRVRAASVRMLGLTTDVDFGLFGSLDPRGKDCFAEALVGRLRVLALPQHPDLAVPHMQLEKSLDILVKVAESSERADRARELAIGFVFSAPHYDQTPASTKERLGRRWIAWQSEAPEGMSDLIGRLTKIEEDSK